MATWAPQQAGLQEILQTIHESTDTNNTEVQRNITLVSYLIVLFRSCFDRVVHVETQQLHEGARLHSVPLLHSRLHAWRRRQDQDNRGLSS